MRTFPLVTLGAVLSLLIGVSSSAVTMDWTPVGNPGNACDPQIFASSPVCFGAVDYDYAIGTYEVTNAQYAEFLNAKAAADPLALWNLGMGSPLPSSNGGITRSGVSGSFSYNVVAGRENMPVNWVSFYSAQRFANWMNNGQGNADTETGAYTLLGGTAAPSNGRTVPRNSGATLVLPSEDEWYKAAYYSAASTSYFDHATGSDTQPTCTAPTATANSANCDAPGPDGTDADVDHLTIRGSFTGSASPYGTYDQAGNVSEWTEGIVDDLFRVERGGAFNYPNAAGLAASSRGPAEPGTGFNSQGFRLVLIPEPNTGLLVIAGLVGLAVRRRVCH